MMISLIVGMDRNGLIGLGNKLPWHRPEDLKNFYKLTKYHVIIMGSKTYESIGKPLIHRYSIVCTNNYAYQDSETCIFIKPDNMVKKLLSKVPDEVFVIGGSQIYKSFAPYVDRMYITIINQYTDRPEGVECTYFPWPAFYGIEWECINQCRLGNDFHYVFDRKGTDNGSTKAEGQ